MIIPDVNLLIYAYNDQAPGHTKALAWWTELLNGTMPVGLPWVTVSAFIRITTHPRVLTDPLPVGQAVAITRTWLDSNAVRIINPGNSFGDLFFKMLTDIGVGGNLTTDAQYAALAIEYQAELHSCDTDFHRFHGLRWRNPLTR